MPTSKSKARTTARQSASRPGNNTARRKQRSARRTRSKKGWSGWAWRTRPERAALPGWGEVEAKGPTLKQPQAGTFLQRISMGRFLVLLLLVAAGFTAYIGHVYAMQELAVELQRAQRENLQLHLKHNRLKGLFDQRTSPAVIYDRARALGLEEGIEYGPTIDMSE